MPDKIISDNIAYKFANILANFLFNDYIYSSFFDGLTLFVECTYLRLRRGVINFKITFAGSLYFMNALVYIL